MHAEVRGEACKMQDNQLIWKRDLFDFRERKESSLKLSFAWKLH